jgi:hypothetical protein
MAEKPRRGEVDLAPLFLWSLAGITGLGIFGSLKLYERLRAARLGDQPAPPPETPPDGDGKPTS